MLNSHYNENSFARAFGGAGVRVNAGGDAPPDPPSVGDVMGPFPFLCFLKIIFLAKSGIIFLARALELQETLTNKWRD